MTDWNAEAELLKGYLAYCIEWRFNQMVFSNITLDYKSIPYKTPEQMMELLNQQGFMIIDDLPTEITVLTFETWNSCSKGNFVWEDVPDSKVVFQPNENGRWIIATPTQP